MSTPSRKYALTVAICAALVVSVTLIGLFFRLQDGANLWVFTYFPYVASAALLLAIPIPLVWLVVAARKKKWDSVKSMAIAVIATIVAAGGAAMATWRIMRELFPA
jgi:hypothetical protein